MTMVCDEVTKIHNYMVLDTESDEIQRLKE